MDFPCAANSCIVFTTLLLIMAASCVHAIFMLHSLQPSHGGVNFILAQLYVGVYKTDRFLLVRAAPGWSEPGNRRCSSSNRRHSCEGRVNSSVGSGSANRRCLQESRGFRPRRSA